MKYLILIAIFYAVILLASCTQVQGPLLLAIEKETPWEAGVTYFAGHYINEAGLVYLGLLDGNRGNRPAVSPAWWQPE